MNVLTPFCYVMLPYMASLVSSPEHVTFVEGGPLYGFELKVPEFLRRFFPMSWVDTKSINSSTLSTTGTTGSTGSTGTAGIAGTMVTAGTRGDASNEGTTGHFGYSDIKEITDTIESTEIGICEPNDPKEFCRQQTVISIDDIDEDGAWFEQKLDHFNFADTRTWRQRFYKNDHFYQIGGPVFLMIGGHSEIRVSEMQSGAWIDYAERVNAYCLYLEHRFLGKSRPTDNTGTDNLGYLSSEQALADVAWFIKNINHVLQEDKHLSKAKWVVFGVSYGGALAAWSRIKYPHLIHAAVSSSAPLLAKVHNEDYQKVLEEALDTECKVCKGKITKMFQDIKKTHDTAKYDLKTKFSLCTTPSSKLKDAEYFFWTLADIIGLIMQYGNSHLKTLKQAIFSIMNDDTHYYNEIESYAQVIKVTLKHFHKDCLSISYDAAVESFQNTSWNADPISNFPVFPGFRNRQNYFLNCMQLGSFPTFTRNHLFNETISLPFYVDFCKEIFGKKFGIKTLSEGVEKTNTLYGEQNIVVSRVIFVNGYRDPWKTLGITQKFQLKVDNNDVILIPGASHGDDMVSKNDLPQFQSFRDKILNRLIEWLK